MTYQGFSILFNVAKACDTIDEFLVASVIQSAAGATEKQLEAIFVFGKNPTFPTLREISGLTQRAFAESYSVTLRSIECWSSGYRKPTMSTLVLLAFAVICDIQEETKEKKS